MLAFGNKHHKKFPWGGVPSLSILLKIIIGF